MEKSSDSDSNKRNYSNQPGDFDDDSERYYERLKIASDFILQKCALRPKLCIICGSGLGLLCDSIKNQVQIPYKDIPYVPTSSVIGHDNLLVFGDISGVPVVAMRGRVHFYEGYKMREVVFLLRSLRMCGLKTLIVTSAVGGINPTFEAGDAMVIQDIINLPGLTGNNPILGQNDERIGTRFPVMSGCFDKDLGDLFKKCATELGYHDRVKEGVMAIVSGPPYETPAEIRFLRVIGADSVGMSVGPEMIAARHCGYQYILGVNLVTNKCSGKLGNPDDHLVTDKEGKTVVDGLHLTVIDVSKNSSQRMSSIMVKLVETIPDKYRS